MSRRGLPPGSRLPAALQALQVFRDPLGHYDRQRRRYGDLFTVAFPGFGRLVYVGEPSLVKQIFTADPSTVHAGVANATVLEPAVGPSSILTLDGPQHLRQRRLLLPPFHGESIVRYAGIIRDAVDRDLETWPVGEPFELRAHTQAITLDVILRAVFGIADHDRLARASAVVEQFTKRADLVLLFPILRRPLGRYSPWNRFVQARDALDRLIYDEIAQRRADPDADQREDVLSLLLQARDEDGSPLSDRELRDELVTVLGAGHETTATALAWAVERLLNTPRVLERLRASLAAGEQDYLEATVKETLRMRPVIADVGRRAMEPIELGGYTIPAGTYVIPSIATLHYRDDIYPEPHEFRPERFLEGEDPGGYGWIPFGGGIRRCVGAAFAQYEMRIVLQAIVERAELRPAGDRPESPRIRHITLAPANDARVVLGAPLKAPIAVPA
jgi:cytochrome P450